MSSHTRACLFAFVAFFICIDQEPGGRSRGKQRALFAKAWCPFDRYDHYDRCDRSEAVNPAIAERLPNHVHLIVPIVQKTSKITFFWARNQNQHEMNLYRSAPWEI